jgi:hypothetical protein
MAANIIMAIETASILAFISLLNSSIDFFESLKYLSAI